MSDKTCEKWEETSYDSFLDYGNPWGKEPIEDIAHNYQTTKNWLGTNDRESIAAMIQVDDQLKIIGSRTAFNLFLWLKDVCRILFANSYGFKVRNE